MTKRKQARQSDRSFDLEYAKVDITNDLMFSTVMQDEALCIELLSCLLPLQPGRKIERLQYRQFADQPLQKSGPSRGGVAVTQKTMLGYFGQRGVRLDVFVDDGKTIYDLEMQTIGNVALPQRSRLIQAHMDISQLQPGARYDELRPSYVIFICKFDPFGDGLYRYTFSNTCAELSGKSLGDGTCKIFLNTAGHGGDIPPRLRELLTYMNDTQAYRVEDTDNDLIKKIDDAVNETKLTPVWRDAFMMYQLRLQDEAIRSRREGLEEGRAEGEAKGRAEGEAKGHADVAKRMLLKAMPLDLVSELSGLSLAELAKLKAELAL